MEFLAWAPPFTTFIMGTGSTWAFDATQVLEERSVALHGRRLGRRQRHGEDRVGSEARLVRGAVEIDHREVDGALILRVEAFQEVADLAVHVLDRVRHALAAPGVAAVTQFDRFVHPGRGPRRRHRASGGARLQVDVDLDGRVAPRVKDLASQDNFNRTHDAAPLGWDLQITRPWISLRKSFGVAYLFTQPSRAIS